MPDITEQILNSTGKYDDWHASPEAFLEEVNRRVATFLCDVESDVGYVYLKGHNEFTYASTNVKHGLMGYVETGLYLELIKRHWWVYKRKFKNFNDYCQKLIGRGSWYANALIKAAKVCLILIKEGFTILPMCEAQARPLTKYVREDSQLTGINYDDELVAKWAEAVETAPARGITASHVSAIVDGQPEEETKKQIKVAAKTHQRLQRLALEKGISVDELVEQLLDDYESGGETDEEPSPEAIAKWQSDLEGLVREFDEEVAQCTPPFSASANTS